MDTASTTPEYNATTDVPCRECGGPTIPPTPGRPEEMGHYCEACGLQTGNATGDAFPEVMDALSRLRGAKDTLYGEVTWQGPALQEVAPNVFETAPGRCVCRDGAISTPADHWPTCPKHR